jgi:hypothetical protein
MTQVVENARLELLRCLAAVEEWVQRAQAEDEAQTIDIRTGLPNVPGATPTHVPLFVEDWGSGNEDILLAAKEAALLGDIEYNDAGHHPNGPMVRITPQGYKKIRDTSKESKE